MHFSSRIFKRRELRFEYDLEKIYPISKRRKNTEKIAQQITGKIYVQVALYIFTNQSDSNMTEVKYNENRFVIISYHNAMKILKNV